MNNQLRNIFVAISIFFLTLTLFAQNAKVTWQTNLPSLGISKAITYTSVGGKQYILLTSPFTGKAWSIKVNSDGTTGGIAWQTYSWERGISAMAKYTPRAQSFILLSGAQTGEFWIKPLRGDGSVGNQNMFYTNKFEKGISVMATFNAQGQDYVFLYNPFNGHAWTFRLNADGTLGENTWHQSWEPGISTCATYKFGQQNYIALSNPKDGKAWIIELMGDGRVGDFVWSTSKWERGFDALTVSELYGRLYMIVSSSRRGELISYRLDNMGTNPVEVWSKDRWDRGITGLTSFTGSFGKGFVFLTNPLNGKAWVITDFNYGLSEAGDRNSHNHSGFEDSGTRASNNGNDLIPKNQPFFIQSALSYGKSEYGFWDLPGRPRQIVEHSHLQLNALSRREDRDIDRRYEIEDARTRGYVKIHIAGVAGYVDIIDASNKKGAHLQIYKPHFTSAQLFRFVYMGHGRWKIFNENGKIILAQNRTASNRTPLQMWDNENGPWTEWYLIDARTNQIFYPHE